jgi:non-heme chloroperoxidase
MSIVKINDGTEIYSKEWRSKHAQLIMFHHSGPLSSDDWDAQLSFSLQHGYRVVAHDRLGHGTRRRPKRAA